MTRRAVLIGVPAIAVLGVGVGRLRPRQRAPLAVRGADISFLLQEEEIGRSFSRQGTTRKLEQILADVGATHARLRVWVNPPSGYSDESSALRLARRAHAAGLEIVLDVHYSDVWADHTSQPTPAAWANESMSDLVDTVGRYSSHLTSRFAAQGTPVAIMQIGNEITSGMLWPYGLLDGGPESWDRLAQLVNSGITGARAGNPRGNGLDVALHISTGGDQQGSQEFFDALTAAGVRDFDIIALSYYPWWNGGLPALARNLDNLARRFGRDVLVMETAYPWTVDPSDSPSTLVASAQQLPQGATYPPTPEGQRNYFTGLRDVLDKVPDGRGLGFVDWEPDWLAGVAAMPGGSDPYSITTMFDTAGAALPAVESAFRPPA